MKSCLLSIIAKWLKVNIYLRGVVVDKTVKKKGSMIVDSFDPIQTSLKVLKLCNVVKGKHKKIDTLHPGEGHLISTLENSIS